MKKRVVVVSAVALFVLWTIAIALVAHTRLSDHAHAKKVRSAELFVSTPPKHVKPSPISVPAVLSLNTSKPKREGTHVILSPLSEVPTHRQQLFMSAVRGKIEMLLSPLPLGLECSVGGSPSILQCDGKRAVNGAATSDLHYALMNVSFHSDGSLVVRSSSTGTYLSRDAHTSVVTMDKIQAKSLEKWSIRRVEGGFNFFGVRSQFQPDADAKCVGGDETELKVVRSGCTLFQLYKPATLAAMNPLPAPPRTSVVVGLTYRSLFNVTNEQRFSLETSIKMWFVFLETMLSKVSVSAALIFCLDDVRDEAHILELATSSGLSAEDVREKVVTLSDCEKHPVFGNQPTYRGVFSAAERHGRRLFGERFFVLHSNSDIILDAVGVAKTLSATSSLSSRLSRGAWRPILVSGRRWNCDPSTIVTGIKDGRASGAFLKHHCSLFGDNAQDYFLVSNGALHWDASSGGIFESRSGSDLHSPASAYWRELRANRWNLDAHIVPPFVVGGIAFDNWFVSAMMGLTHDRSKNGWVIDATATVGAFHINHGASRFASHRQPKSKYNLEMAHYCNGWAEGKVGVSPFVALHSDAHDSVYLHQRGLLMCNRNTSVACILPLRQPNAHRKSAFDGRWEPF